MAITSNHFHFRQPDAPAIEVPTSWPGTRGRKSSRAPGTARTPWALLAFPPAMQTSRRVLGCDKPTLAASGLHTSPPATAV